MYPCVHVLIEEYLKVHDDEGADTRPHRARTGIHYYINLVRKVPRRGPRAAGAARTQGNTQGRARATGLFFPVSGHWFVLESPMAVSYTHLRAHET